MRDVRIGDTIKWYNDDTVYTIGNIRSSGDESDGELLFEWPSSTHGVWSYRVESFNREIREGNVIILTTPISPVQRLRKHEFN